MMDPTDGKRECPQTLETPHGRARDAATSTPGGQLPGEQGQAGAVPAARRTRRSMPRQRGNHPRRQTPARHASSPGSAPPVSQQATVRAA